MNLIPFLSRRADQSARVRQAVSALILFVVAGGFLGCARENKYVEPPPPEVTVTHPSQHDVIEYLEAAATAAPVLSVEIRARVRGFLKECLVEEGASVRAGELLLVIDEGPFQVQLDQAKAKLAETETVLQKAKQSQAREISRAQLALDESQLRVAITEEERMRPLVSTRTISQEDMDRAQANRQKNEAQVASTKANLVQIDADYATNILSAQANVAVAKTVVHSAEIDLGYCRIKSPTDGRIGRIIHDVGNLVGDGEATLLTTVMKFDPIHVYATLSVNDFLKYQSIAATLPSRTDSIRKMPVELALADETGFRHVGQIDYHDPMVDKGTGTIELRGVFPNPKEEILPGMFARIRIPIANRRNAILVPDQALGIDQAGQYVLVVGADDKVDHRQVQVGRVDKGMRVIEGKIGPQDRVIVEGLLRARPGMKVVPHLQEIEQDAAAPPAAGPRVSAAPVGRDAQPSKTN